MPLTFKRTRTKAVTSFILVLILAAGLFTPWAGMPQARAAGDGPDLAVDSIAAPETILAGHEVTVTASVYNTGNVPAEEFAVTLFAGQEEIQSKTVSSVYAGETAEVTFAWAPAQPGEYVLRVLADSSNRVAETDETNNELTKEVTVGSGGEDTTVARVREAIARVTNYVKTQGTYSSDWLVVGLRNADEEIPAGYLSEVEAAVQNYFATWVNT
ncbi:MAG: hypothetical protein K6U04_09185, partial [Armatimonadetes bacterium]|nr:hypothetical protein [Armatimonadota bacterium]